MGNIMTCKINADTSDGLKIVSDTSGVVDIQDNGTTRLTVGDTIDIQGNELVLDADADTSIHASTDDQIDFKIAGADDFSMTANGFNVLSGSTLNVNSGATITNSGTANGFGIIKQIIHATTTSQTGTTAAAFTATNCAAQITPSVAANKIIVMVSSSVYISAANQQASATIYRDSTNLSSSTDRGIVQFWDSGDLYQGDCSIMLTDHPNTTNAVTYALYIRKLSAGGSQVFAGVDSTSQFITLLEVQV